MKGSDQSTLPGIGVTNIIGTAKTNPRNIKNISLFNFLYDVNFRNNIKIAVGQRTKFTLEANGKVNSQNPFCSELFKTISMKALELR